MEKYKIYGMNISFFLLLCSILATAIVSGNQNGGMNAYTLNITGPFTHTLNVPFLNYTTFLPFRVSFSITTGKNTENNNSTRGLLLLLALYNGEVLSFFEDGLHSAWLAKSDPRRRPYYFW